VSTVGSQALRIGCRSIPWCVQSSCGPHRPLPVEWRGSPRHRRWPRPSDRSGSCRRRQRKHGLCELWSIARPDRIERRTSAPSRSPRPKPPRSACRGTRGRIAASGPALPNCRRRFLRLNAACWHRQRSGWHRRRRLFLRPVPLPCSAAPPSRTACAGDRNRGSDRAYSLRRLNDLTPGHRGRNGKTSDKRGSGGPRRTTDARNECRSGSRPTASARAARDQSMAVRLSCRMASVHPECSTKPC
jgi:hypothetical protein